MQEHDTTTKLVSFIRFHGLNLPVVQHEGTDYVPAKPLNDLACIDWRTTKRALIEPESVKLYGTKALIPPSIAFQGGDIPTQEVLFLRLDRARIFLARVQTARMRSHGNVEAADRLLALQIEWAKVLHDYETTGIAVKPGTAREITGLIKAIATATDPGMRHALTQMAKDMCAALGYPVPENPQQALPLNTNPARPA